MALASGFPLYLVMAALMYLMWQQIRGLSFDAILHKDHDFHIRVHHVLATHPDGGTWSDYQTWMREDQTGGGEG